MKKLKYMIASGAAALLVTGVMATPSAAQPWRDYDRGYGDYQGDLTTSYVDSLEWRIHNAAREGRISWGQARVLLRDFRAVQNLAWRVETGQASRWEYRRLRNVVDRIEAATTSYARYERYPRYGYNRYR